MDPALAWLIAVLVVFGPGIAVLIFMSRRSQDINAQIHLAGASSNPPQNPIDSIASEVAKRVAANFSAVRFPDFFGSEPFREGWNRNDALAVWYCLGYFCFLVAGGSAVKDESTATVLLDLGLKHLLQRWKMPPLVSARFEQFCRAKLGSVFTVYESLSNAREFGKFFCLFVSEIVGNDITFSRESLDSILLVLQGKQINADIVLHQSVSGFFVAALNEAKEYIRANLMEAAHPENAASGNAELRETKKLDPSATEPPALHENQQKLGPTDSMNPKAASSDGKQIAFISIALAVIIAIIIALYWQNGSANVAGGGSGDSSSANAIVNPTQTTTPLASSSGTSDLQQLASSATERYPPCPAGLNEGAQVASIQDPAILVGSAAKIEGKWQLSFALSNKSEVPDPKFGGYCITAFEVEADLENTNGKVWKMVGVQRLGSSYSYLSPGWSQNFTNLVLRPLTKSGGTPTPDAELTSWNVTKVWGFPLVHPDAPTQ